MTLCATEIRKSRRTVKPSAPANWWTGRLTAPAARHLTPAQLDTLKAILASKLECMMNPAFLRADTEKALFEDAPAIPRFEVTWCESASDKTGGESFLTAKGARLTTPQERTLFLQYNYCRHRLIKPLKAARRKPIDLQTAREVLHWNARAEHCRELIVRANLGLVPSMVRRQNNSRIRLTDLISEGNLALLRAIEKFDIARGFKFSTYACRAILKAFSRYSRQQSRIGQMFPVGFDPDLERPDFSSEEECQQSEAVADLRHILHGNQANLTSAEIEVLGHRFALGADHEDGALTLEEIGSRIGVCKERVRQIQEKALAKLRVVMEARLDGTAFMGLGI